MTDSCATRTGTHTSEISHLHKLGYGSKRNNQRARVATTISFVFAVIHGAATIGSMILKIRLGSSRAETGVAPGQMEIVVRAVASVLEQPLAPLMRVAGLGVIFLNSAIWGLVVWLILMAGDYLLRMLGGHSRGH